MTIEQPFWELMILCKLLSIFSFISIFLFSVSICLVPFSVLTVRFSEMIEMMEMVKLPNGEMAKCWQNGKMEK